MALLFGPPLLLVALAQCGEPVQNTYQAGVAIAGDWLVSGRPESDGPPRVHRREGNGWSAGTALVPSVVQGGTYYGHAVAIEGDVIAVGRPLAGFSAGAVHVFERNGDVWSETAMLTPSDPVQSAHMGWSVAVSQDRIAAGSSQTNGRVHVFEKIASVWTETAVLTPACCAGSGFGRGVALSGDVLVVAATNHGAGHGPAYIYRRGPTQWQLEHSVPPGGGLLAGAAAVAVRGSEVLVGSGVVHVLRYGAGGWKLHQIIAPTPASYGFGRALALGPGALVVGNPELAVGGVNSTGAAYLYRLGTHGYWEYATSFDKPPGFLRYGRQVSTDGERATVSALFAETDVFSVSPSDGLTATPSSISLSAGGSQLLQLDAGLYHAAHFHIVVGSASGTVPGLPLGSVHLPLNFDAYTSLSLSLANTPTFVNTIGALDSCGRATSAIQLPPGAPAGLAGLQLHHAYVAMAPSGELTYASQAGALLLTP